LHWIEATRQKLDNDVKIHSDKEITTKINEKNIKKLKRKEVQSASSYFFNYFPSSSPSSKKTNKSDQESVLEKDLENLNQVYTYI
jgi:hypothetical protein